MTEQIKTDLGSVQKTLFLPLWGRAEESKKRNPLLVDETAVRIIGQINFDFSQITQNIDDLTQIAWIKRSLFCDRVVKEFLNRFPAGTIINIGCGLDTTFERTDNGKLKWYDIDLPDTIEIRKKFVQESERRKFIAASFLEEQWLESIQVVENVLFIAAGVFYYIEEPKLKEFLIRLIDRYPGSEILFDVASPLGVRVANKKVIESAGLDKRSHLIWGLEKTEALLSWDPRIEIIHTYYYFQTQVRGLRNKLMGMLSDYLRIQYLIHLRLGKVA